MVSGMAPILALRTDGPGQGASHGLSRSRLQVDDQHVVVCVTLVTEPEPDDRDLMDPEDIPPYP